MQQDSATTRNIEGRDGPVVTVGLDVGDRYTHVHALGASGEVVRERRVRTAAAALGAALTGLPPSRVVLEAGPRSPWLSRLMADLGQEVGRRQPSPGRADRPQPAQDRPPRRRVAGAAGALRPGTARPDPPQERAESAQPRRGARPRRAGALAHAAHQPRARRRQGLRRRAAVLHGQGLSPQGGRPHPRRAASGAAAAGGGGRRADRAHRSGRPRGRGAVRGSPRDHSAAPGHGRGADHRAHVRADDRGPGSLPAEPGGGGLPRARAAAARVRRARGGRSSASPRAATRACGGCWCRPLTTSSVPSDPIPTCAAGVSATRGLGRATRRSAPSWASRGGWRCCCSRWWKTGEVYEPLRHAAAREAA